MEVEEGGQVRVAGLPIVVCAALASGFLLFLPHAGRRNSAKRGRRSGAVAGEVQRAGGQWMSRRCRGAAADQPGSSGRTV